MGRLQRRRLYRCCGIQRHGPCGVHRRWSRRLERTGVHVFCGAFAGAVGLAAVRRRGPERRRLRGCADALGDDGLGKYGRAGLVHHHRQRHRYIQRGNVRRRHSYDLRLDDRHDHHAGNHGVHFVLDSIPGRRKRNDVQLRRESFQYPCSNSRHHPDPYSRQRHTPVRFVGHGLLLRHRNRHQHAAVPGGGDGRFRQLHGGHPPRLHSRHHGHVVLEPVCRGPGVLCAGFGHFLRSGSGDVLDPRRLHLRTGDRRFRAADRCGAGGSDAGESGAGRGARDADRKPLAAALRYFVRDQSAGAGPDHLRRRQADECHRRAVRTDPAECSRTAADGRNDHWFVR